MLSLAFIGLVKHFCWFLFRNETATEQGGQDEEDRTRTDGGKEDKTKKIELGL